MTLKVSSTATGTVQVAARLL